MTMQDLHRPLSIILPTFLLLSAAGAFAQETAVEYSNRISITEDRLVAGFEEASLDGFHAESGLTLSMSDAFHWSHADLTAFFHSIQCAERGNRLLS